MAYRRSTNKTKDYYIHQNFDLERQLYRMRQENSKISQALSNILMTRSKLKEQVEAEVQKEMDELRDQNDTLQEKIGEAETVEALESEREKFLNALGIDAVEWDRISYKF